MCLLKTIAKNTSPKYSAQLTVSDNKTEFIVYTIVQFFWIMINNMRLH
jgi:hypothetical protein